MENTALTNEIADKTQWQSARDGKPLIDIEKATQQNNGAIVGNSKDSVLTHQFRGIKRTIINQAFVNRTQSNDNLVLVSSAKKGEGKTFFASNLALNVAMEKDTTVLLVDSNVINPNLHKLLGFEGGKGLMEYLLNEEQDVANIIYQTTVPNLKVIPAGTPNFLATELLASERMKKLTKELSDRYSDRLVIFDAPPINGVTETPVLASLMGQAILTADASKTDLNALKQATELIDDKVKVGVVVNKVVSRRKDRTPIGI